MMRQQIQSDDGDGDGDDEGIRICVLLHRNVEVVFACWELEETILSQQ